MDAWYEATPAQKAKLLEIWKRNADGAEYFVDFIDKCSWNAMFKCVMVEWCGMVLGIEQDGYSHS